MTQRTNGYSQGGPSDRRELLPFLPCEDGEDWPSVTQGSQETPGLPVPPSQTSSPGTEGGMSLV